MSRKKGVNTRDSGRAGRGGRIKKAQVQRALGGRKL